MELIRRGLACDQIEAADLVYSGVVQVGGSVASNPARMVLPSDAICISSPKEQFVSRGGTKLEHALDEFSLDPSGRVCLDAGASTGGFTDCLLQRGARLVYAIDVGKGQLHPRVCEDARVVVMDGLNVRHLTPAQLSFPPSMVVADLSFIGLRQVCGALVDVTAYESDFVFLVKPQFEARRRQVEPGGVVRDPEVHTEVLERVISDIGKYGLRLNALVASPITGRAGNIEFFGHWVPQGNANVANERPTLISRVVAEAHAKMSCVKEEATP